MNSIIQMLESKVFIGCSDPRSSGLQQYDLPIYCSEERFFPQHLYSRIGIHIQVTDHSKSIFDDRELNCPQHERWYGSPKFIEIHRHNNQRLTFHGVVLMPRNQGVHILKSPLNWVKLFPHSCILQVKLMKNLGESCHVPLLQTSDLQCGPRKGDNHQGQVAYINHFLLRTTTTWLNIVMCMFTLASDLFIIRIFIDTWRAYALGP